MNNIGQDTKDLFQVRKQDILNKKDNSGIGKIDEDIKGLLDVINAKNDYYTTSSCSGRIFVVAIGENKRKDQVQHIFKSHTIVGEQGKQEILKVLANPPQETTWFIQEGMILHVCCRTIEHAQQLVSAAKGCGLKRAGITSTKENRVMVEIVDNERMECPITQDGMLIVSEGYLNVLLEIANTKLLRTKKYITALSEQINKN
jgi:tRNA wybutosine-synthesizing protein 3